MKLRETRRDSDHEHLLQRIAALEKTVADLLGRNQRLEDENAALRRENRQLREKVTRLEQQLAAARKNSSTSSKPPSSDMVKPPKPPRKDGQKRKRGGQPGHEQHLRDPFPDKAIDHVISYPLDACPDCGGKLRQFKEPVDFLQQVE